MIFDRRLFLPAFMQVMAMVAPFLYLRAAMGHGTEATVYGEALLSIVGFAAISIDFSASTFLARSQAWLINRGALLSILIGRLSIAGVLMLAVTPFIIGDGNGSYGPLLASLACMLLGLAADPSWVYIGRGHLWIPAGVGTLRFGTAAVLTVLGLQPIMALGVSFLTSSVFFLCLARIQPARLTRISLRLFFRIAKRYYKPTLTESITAVFSRLDVAVAAALLQPAEALVYAVSRKLIVGLQSVAFSGARVFYLERDVNELQRLQRALLKYTLLAIVLGLPLSVLVAAYWFRLQVDIKLVATLALLSSLIFLGYKKTLIQFGHLYVHRRFSSDLLYSLISMLCFAVLCTLLANFATPTAISFSVARVLADAVYIVIARERRST